METETDICVITHAGLEDVCKDEVKSLLGVDATTSKGSVFFRAKLIDICRFCYKTRSALRVLVVLGRKTVSDLMLGAAKLADTVPVESWLDKTTTFACRSSIPEFGQEIAAEVGGILNDRTGAPVNLSKPTVTVIVHATDGDVLIGIDIGGEEVGKRDYRIFLGNDSLRGTIAYGLLITAGFEGDQNIVDIFCRSGVMPIEAALMASGISSHKHMRDFAFRRLPRLSGVDWEAEFDAMDKKTLKQPKCTIICMDDSFGSVSAAKKNAKIAGVHTHIEFSRTDLRFLDAKFGKGGLDMIVTMPPQPSARINGVALEKALHEMVYQAEFILKKNGKLAVVTKANVQEIKNLCAEFKLMPLKEKSVFQGGLELKMLVFTK
jgi:putative N6-adenine-specific DNA methylase